MYPLLWPSVTKDLQVEQRLIHRRNQLSLASSELSKFYENCFNKCDLKLVFSNKQLIG